MNKKEVLEIRKQFSPKNCAITKICGCYVDYEKNKKMESKDAFLALPDTFRKYRKEYAEYGVSTGCRDAGRNAGISSEAS